MPLNNKKAGHKVTGSFWRCKLNSAGNLARTQATGAGVDVLGRTVYNSLETPLPQQLHFAICCTSS